MYLSLGLGVVFLTLPKVGDLIIKYWFKLGGVLGKINGTILLSIIYCFVLIPTAFLKRISSGTSIKMNAPKKTNFIERNHTFQSKDLKYGW